MMRRIWVAALAVTMVAASLPTSLFAEETRPKTNNQLARIAEGLKAPRTVTVSLPAGPVQLQQAQPQTQSEPFFKTRNGKLAIGVASLAAAITVGYMLTRGPDPRQWP